MAIWYCSFHGGDDAGEWNNIHAFSEDGEHLGKVLASHDLPQGVGLRELRGFAFGPDGDLYVANAWQDRSQVLRFGGTRGADGRHPFREVFVERQRDNPGLAHPFHVAFGPDHNLFIPSQDTNVVGRYHGPTSSVGTPGSPMAHPPALAEEDHDKLLAGTFVPAAKHVKTGLHAVRHVLFAPDGLLYVCDREADAVHAYHPTSGALQRSYRHGALAAPVHLLWWPERQTLLVGSRDRDEVVHLDPASGAVEVVIPKGTGGLDAPAGLAWTSDGRLAVASRMGRAILTFRPDPAHPDPRQLVQELRDHPEFLMLVPDAAARPA